METMWSEILMFLKSIQITVFDPLINKHKTWIFSFLHFIWSFQPELWWIYCPWRHDDHKPPLVSHRSCSALKPKKQGVSQHMPRTRARVHSHAHSHAARAQRRVYYWWKSTVGEAKSWTRGDLDSTGTAIFVFLYSVSTRKWASYQHHVNQQRGEAGHSAGGEAHWLLSDAALYVRASNFCW